MTQGRHRASHKLEKPKSPVLRAASLAAPAVTLGAVSAGVVLSGSGAAMTADLSGTNQSKLTEAEALESRTEAASRSAARPVEVATQVGTQLRLRDKKFTTAALDLRFTPEPNAEVAGTLASASKVIATGQRDGKFAEVKVDGEYYWVTAEYLVDNATDDPAALGLSMKACPGVGTESGLTSSAVRVYRAVCNNFPEITHIGGWDNHGEHSSGRALDIMTSDNQLGTRIAEFLRAHAAELHLYDVIWRQHIWTPVRSGEGWRYMPSRGSATANHYDHVHVSTY